LQINQTIQEIAATDSDTLWHQFQDLERKVLRKNVMASEIGAGISS
jgi:hypothetical protein